MRFPLIILLLFTIVLSGCNTLTSASENDHEREDVLNISLGTDLLTWDIHNHVNSATESVHINVFDYLIMRDWENEGEFTPHLAKEWKQVDDVTWNFVLRDDVYFHNGDQLTSEDVKYTLERVANDETLKSNGDYNAISQVEIIDDFNFNIITHEPDPMLESRISRQASGILPKDYIEKNGMKQFLKEPVGTGPLKFESWSRGSEVSLVPNEHYFKEPITTWNEVNFKAITENSTRVSELITGGLDIAANVAPSDWERIETESNVELVKGDSNRTYLLFLNMEDGMPAQDINVRKAMDYAIDDAALVQLLRGGGTPVKTRINPGNLGFDKTLYDDYNYNPEISKKLLSESGYTDGLTIKLMGTQGRYLQDSEVIQMVAGMLNEVGIEVELDILEYSVFVEERANKNFGDGYLIALGSSFFDSGQSLAYYSPETTSTIFGYDNSTVSNLLVEAETSVNKAEREKNYQEVQQIVAEELPILPLFQLDQFYGVKNGLDIQLRLDELIYIPDLEKLNQ